MKQKIYHEQILSIHPLFRYSDIIPELNTIYFCPLNLPFAYEVGIVQRQGHYLVRHIIQLLYERYQIDLSAHLADSEKDFYQFLENMSSVQLLRV